MFLSPPSQISWDNADPYPLYEEFWRCSDRDQTDDGFTDLYWADFISTVGRVSRRKLERLHASPYHHALTGGKNAFIQGLHGDYIVIL